MQVQVQVVTSPGGEVYPGLEGEEGEGEHHGGRQPHGQQHLRGLEPRRDRAWGDRSFQTSPRLPSVWQ